MKKTYKTTSYSLLSVLALIILISTGIGATFMPVGEQQGKDKIKVVAFPEDAICNKVELWNKTDKIDYKRREKYEPVDDEVTFSGKVDLKFGEDRNKYTGKATDDDSTFDLIVDRVYYPDLNRFIKKVKNSHTIYLDSPIHCEVIDLRDTLKRNELYSRCNCSPPRMPADGDSVQVTGRLVLDKHWVDQFHDFELHPVARIYNYTQKR